MGNTFGAKKTTKVMKIDGETFKLKTPVKVREVLKDHPGLVLLDSEAVKHYGVKAKPLEAHKELQPKRLYFLVELPKETKPRRVRSGINMSAKDRLESLVLTRRSASDLSIMKQSNNMDNNENNGGGVRLKMRLPKAEVEKLIQGCKDEAEAAERIMKLYMANGSRENEGGTKVMVKRWLCWNNKELKRVQRRGEFYAN
uniref:Plastid movement impaired protein n=1 Tax=Glycine max TaxID=3847 RepID=C6SZB7_SOYBN|nr:unknown [Glycine max]